MTNVLRRLPVREITVEIECRFWQKVDRKGPADCWLWDGHRLPGGAGTLAIKREKFYASRVSWYIAHRKDPYPLWILHNCPSGDNPACVNPTHLYLGDCSQNAFDQYAKGQRRSLKGYQYPHRYPAERNAEIIQLWNTGKYTQVELGARFNVNQSLISMIVNGYFEHRPHRKETLC